MFLNLVIHEDFQKFLSKCDTHSMNRTKNGYLGEGVVYLLVTVVSQHNGHSNVSLLLYSTGIVGMGDHPEKKMTTQTSPNGV